MGVTILFYKKSDIIIDVAIIWWSLGVSVKYFLSCDYTYVGVEINPF